MKVLFALLVLGCSCAALAGAATYDEARGAARTAAEAGHFAAARKSYAQAVALAKTPAEKGAAWLRIGETFKVEGNRAEARSWWNKVVDTPGTAAPDRLTAGFAIGFSFLDDNEPAKARAQFTKISGSKDLNLQAQERALLGLSVGTTYAREKRYAQAREAWDAVLAKGYTGPSVAPVLQAIQLASADSYLDEGNLAQARSAYRKMVDSDVDASLPADEQQQLRGRKQLAQLKLASSYLAEKDYVAAKDAYRKVLQMEPPVAALKAEAQKGLDLIALKEKGAHP